MLIPMAAPSNMARKRSSPSPSARPAVMSRGAAPDALVASLKEILRARIPVAAVGQRSTAAIGREETSPRCFKLGKAGRALFPQRGHTAYFGNCRDLRVATKCVASHEIVTIGHRTPSRNPASPLEPSMEGSEITADQPVGPGGRSVAARVQTLHPSCPWHRQCPFRLPRRSGNRSTRLCPRPRCRR